MKVTLADFTMAFEDTGRGPTVLFIHGYPLGRRIFDPQLRELLGSARLIVPDLRGHGDSDAPSGGYSIARYARDCLELLDARGVTEPVVVCGLSMGGYVTFELLRQRPDRFAGVVLMGTRASPDSPEQREGRDADAKLARNKGVDAIVDRMLPRLLRPATLSDNPAVTELARRTMEGASLAGVVGDLAAMKERPDSRPDLAKLGKPVLVVHGRDDVIMTTSEAEGMAKAIPGAELLVVPEAGHLVNIEQPAPVNAAIGAFVRRVWAH